MSVVFTLNGLTLTGADAIQDGGAIHSNKTVVLNNCIDQRQFGPRRRRDLR